MSYRSSIPVPSSPRTPRKSDKNKNLPPLPGPVAYMPSTPPRQHLDRQYPRSVSYAAASTPRISLAEASGRQTSLEHQLDRYKITPVSTPRKKTGWEDVEAHIDDTIQKNPTGITDDPTEFGNASWWAGRYSGLSDRLRREMPASSADERDEVALDELILLCNGDQHKMGLLTSWWIQYKGQRDDEGPGLRRTLA